MHAALSMRRSKSLVADDHERHHSNVHDRAKFADFGRLVELHLERVKTIDK
jgi:hypothetical protein